MIAIGLACWICHDALALMVPLATTTLVDRASCIVEGQVTRVESRWTSDRSAIITEVTVNVSDLLLGSTNCATFCYEGGIVDGLEHRVSDMPRLKSGQRVLVFLRGQTSEEAKRDQRAENRTPGHMLLGAAQGLCRIEGGRAIKEGFTLVGDDAAIDRNVEASALKVRIRERLMAMRRVRGEP